MQATSLLCAWPCCSQSIWQEMILVYIFVVCNMLYYITLYVLYYIILYFICYLKHYLYMLCHGCRGTTWARSPAGSAWSSCSGSRWRVQATSGSAPACCRSARATRRGFARTSSQVHLRLRTAAPHESGSFEIALAENQGCHKSLPDGRHSGP